MDDKLLLFVFKFLNCRDKKRDNSAHARWVSQCSFGTEGQPVLYSTTISAHYPVHNTSTSATLSLPSPRSTHLVSRHDMTDCWLPHPPKEEAPSGDAGGYSAYENLSLCRKKEEQEREIKKEDNGSQRVNMMQQREWWASDNDETKRRGEKKKSDKKAVCSFHYLIGHDSLLGDVSSSALLSTTRDTVNNINASIICATSSEQVKISDPKTKWKN